MTANKGSLSGVLVRIERAKTHLADFDMQAKPISAACTVTREHDERSSEFVFRISNLASVPPLLSAIIGDAIHNLRVSLDYLAWQLVIAMGEKAPNWNTKFPICEKQPKAGLDGSTLPDIQPGVPSEVRMLLDELQPYQRAKPKNHDLEVLRTLDNNDKHHDLLITAVGIKDNMIAWWGDAEPSSVKSGPYIDGSEICRFRDSSVDPTSNFKPTVRFDLCFREPDAGPWGKMLSASDLVRRPLSYIENEVLPRFRGFLPSSR